MSGIQAALRAAVRRGRSHLGRARRSRISDSVNSLLALLCKSAGVSLGETREAVIAVARYAEHTRRVSSVSVTRLEDILLFVVAGHDKPATHFVQFMFAHGGRIPFIVASRADTQAELFVRDELHPLGIVLICARDIRRNVAADGVALASGAVRIELTAVVRILQTDLGEVAPADYLYVEGGRDEVHASERAVGNQTCVVARLRAPRYLLPFCVTDRLVGFFGPEYAEVLRVSDKIFTLQPHSTHINGVDGEQSRV